MLPWKGDRQWGHSLGMARMASLIALARWAMCGAWSQMKGIIQLLIKGILCLPWDIKRDVVI